MDEIIFTADLTNVPNDMVRRMRDSYARVYTRSVLNGTPDPYVLGGFRAYDDECERRWSKS